MQLPLARKSATHIELNLSRFLNSKFSEHRITIFLDISYLVTKPREHCIIIFLDILDFVEKLKVEMARRKIDSFSPHNKIFIP